MKKITLIAVIMVVMIFGAVAYSFAAPEASDSVDVSATVGRKIEITVPATLDLGTILPDASAYGTVNVDVRSNKVYTISRDIVNPVGLTVTGIAIPAGFAKTPGVGTVDTWTDTLNGAVDWNATAGTTLTCNVTYTAAQ